MAKFAATTKVPVSQSRNEIERTLVRYGASAFGYVQEAGRAAVQFRIEERYARVEIPVPETLSDQEVRQRWRALLLVIKAKLEAVDSGISTIEEEFLAHILLPNNQTVGEFTLPQIQRAYDAGELPALLPGAAE